jgi:hypothetical protein
VTSARSPRSGELETSFARSLVPKLTALRRDLETYLDYYNYDRAHTGRSPTGAPVAGVGCEEDEAEMNDQRRHISESVQPRRLFTPAAAFVPDPAVAARRGGSLVPLQQLETTLLVAGPAWDVNGSRKQRVVTPCTLPRLARRGDQRAGRAKSRRSSNCLP